MWGKAVGHGVGVQRVNVEVYWSLLKFLEQALAKPGPGHNERLPRGYPSAALLRAGPGTGRRCADRPAA